MKCDCCQFLSLLLDGSLLSRTLLSYFNLWQRGYWQLDCSPKTTTAYLSIELFGLRIKMWLIRFTDSFTLCLLSTLFLSFAGESGIIVSSGELLAFTSSTLSRFGRDCSRTTASNTSSNLRKSQHQWKLLKLYSRKILAFTSAIFIHIIKHDG